MAILNFTTSGMMNIELQDARFGEIMIDPDKDPNVKSFSIGPNHLSISVHDMKKFSAWGRVQILDIGQPGGSMTVTVDTHTVGWYGSAQFSLHYENSQHIVSDNFQSGWGGDPNSKKSKRYNIISF